MFGTRGLVVLRGVLLLVLLAVPGYGRAECLRRPTIPVREAKNRRRDIEAPVLYSYIRDTFFGVSQYCCALLMYTQGTCYCPFALLYKDTRCLEILEALFFFFLSCRPAHFDVDSSRLICLLRFFRPNLVRNCCRCLECWTRTCRPWTPC